jgi:hypothetical protein
VGFQVVNSIQLIYFLVCHKNGNPAWKPFSLEKVRSMEKLDALYRVWKASELQLFLSNLILHCFPGDSQIKVLSAAC